MPKTLFSLCLTWVLKMAFYHVENSFYLGGGYGGDYPSFAYFNNFRKILADGEAIELQEMPTPKSGSLWFDGSREELSSHCEEPVDLVWNKFKNSSSQEISGNCTRNSLKLSTSSAVVLNNVIYNVGGLGSSRSLRCCSLCSNYGSKWDFMNYQTKTLQRRTYSGEKNCVFRKMG